MYVLLLMRFGIHTLGNGSATRSCQGKRRDGGCACNVPRCPGVVQCSCIAYCVLKLTLGRNSSIPNWGVQGCGQEKEKVCGR